MHTRLLFAVAGFFLVTSTAHAAVQATMTIDQVSPKEYGTWTLNTADNTTRSSTDAGADKKSYSFTVPEVGQMILSITPPAGMSSKINVYRNGELTQTVDAQQYEFSAFANDTYRFLIQYSYTKLGTLGVTSNPSGLTFRVRGPKRLSGRTPITFENLPAGRYSIYVSAPEGCLRPAPQTALVTAQERVTKLITLNCDQEKEEAYIRTEHKSRRSLIEEVEQRRRR